MTEKKTEELRPLKKTGSSEGEQQDRPRKWKFEPVSFIKTVFKVVGWLKFIFEIADRLWKWYQDL